MPKNIKSVDSEIIGVCQIEPEGYILVFVLIVSVWNLIIQIKKNFCLFTTTELHRGSLELRKMMNQQGRALIFHENCTA